MHVLLDAVQTPQDANGADLALELGLVGNVAFPLADVFLLVVPLQMIHDLRDVLGGEWAEVALKGMHMSICHLYTLYSLYRTRITLTSYISET